MTDHTTWISVAEAAARTGRAAATIRVQFDKGLLSGYRTPRGHRIIDPASLDQPGVTGLTVSEAARRLGCSVETVRKWFDAGDLTGHRDDAGRRRIDPASIEALIIAGGADGPR